MRPPFTLGITTAREQAIADMQEDRYFGRMVEMDEEEAEPPWWALIVRRDSLPDGVEFRDGGCEYSPSCLSCPFPQCRFDRQRSVKGMPKDLHKHALFMSYILQGWSVEKAARAVGISRRSGFRWKASLRGENP